MRNNGRHILFFLTLLWVSHASANAEGTLTKKRFGDYEVILSQDFGSGLGKILIKQRGSEVFTEAGVENHYYFGNDFGDFPEGGDPYSGRDVTGRGIPNLVISNWTGGAHCCHFLSIFELGTKIRKIGVVEANSSAVRLVDMDHDGFLEVEFWDGAIDYLFSSFAGSPAGRVILKFDGDRYRVWSSLMKTPIPSVAEFNALKNLARSSFAINSSRQFPYEFLNSMMKLSYEGHFDLALRLSVESWPSDRPGLEQFKDEFSQALKQSVYWPSLE